MVTKIGTLNCDSFAKGVGRSFWAAKKGMNLRAGTITVALVILFAGTVFIRSFFSGLWKKDKRLLAPPIMAYPTTDDPSFAEINEKVQYLYELTICSVVKNEMPSLLEWIEFHRIQGADHIVLYDDNSTDGVALIPQLYEQIGIYDLVEVLPAPPSFYTTRTVSEARIVYERKQINAINHCYAYIGKRTRWFLFIDPDEFVSSGNGTSLLAVLNDPKWDRIGSIQTRNINYGTSTKNCPNFVDLVMNNDTGLVEVIYGESLAGDGWAKVNETYFPLVIESNPNRMPYDDLDLDPGPAYARSCTMMPHGVWEIHCPFKIGKFFLRPGACKDLFIHWCVQFTPEYSNRFVVATRHEIRMHHYYAKSSHRIVHQKQWSVKKAETFRQQDTSYMSLVKDEILVDLYMVELRQRISKFSPRMIPSKYKVVDGECIDLPESEFTSYATDSQEI